MDNTIFDVIVEIPKGSKNKYEVDHETGVVRLDRVLHSAVHYPTDYGFIDHTLGSDGDPLDAMVILSQPTFPGCTVETKCVGVFLMADDKGDDEKLICVATGDPYFKGVNSLEDLPEHLLKEIENFFATYKILENKEVEVKGWGDKNKAMQLLDEAKERYQSK